MKPIPSRLACLLQHADQLRTQIAAAKIKKQRLDHEIRELTATLIRLKALLSLEVESVVRREEE